MVLLLGSNQTGIAERYASQLVNRGKYDGFVTLQEVSDYLYAERYYGKNPGLISQAISRVERFGPDLLFDLLTDKENPSKSAYGSTEHYRAIFDRAALRIERYTTLVFGMMANLTERRLILCSMHAPFLLTDELGLQKSPEERLFIHTSDSNGSYHQTIMEGTPTNKYWESRVGDRTVEQDLERFAWIADHFENVHQRSHPLSRDLIEAYSDKPIELVRVPLFPDHSETTTVMFQCQPRSVRQGNSDRNSMY